MLIELFYNKNGFISGFRHSWKTNSLNKPIKENVYDIDQLDFYGLVDFIAGETAYNMDKVPKIVEECGSYKELWNSKLLRLGNIDYQNKVNQKNIRNILEYN